MASLQAEYTAPELSSETPIFSYHISCRDGLETYASVFEEVAKTLVPVRTGALQASIHAKKSKDGIDFEATMPYASFVEFGTWKMEARPYFEEALAQAYDEAVVEMVDEVLDPYEKEVERCDSISEDYERQAQNQERVVEYWDQMCEYAWQRAEEAFEMFLLPGSPEDHQYWWDQYVMWLERWQEYLLQLMEAMVVLVDLTLQAIEWAVNAMYAWSMGSLDLESILATPPATLGESE